MPKLIDEKTKNKIKLLGSRGTLKAEEIGERVGVARSTVSRILAAEKDVAPCRRKKKKVGRSMFQRSEPGKA